jgi:CRISPR-associated protein (TIGR03985 family)
MNLDGRLLMSNFIPTVERLEKLAPELLQVRFSQRQSEYCLNLLTTATRRWIIVRSLYDEESYYWSGFRQKSFKCSDWQKHLFTEIPKIEQSKSQELLFNEYADIIQQKFLDLIKKSYGFSSEQIEIFLNTYPFQVGERTIRNHFQSLSDFAEPFLKKTQRGEYTKVALEVIQKQLTLGKVTEELGVIDLAFMREDVATIVELLLSKIQGKQRMFMEHNCIVPEALREVAADRADFLKQVWKQTPVSPLKVSYYSANLNQENDYIIYPVCLYYYQRAYYLSAFGQTPSCQNKTQPQWYNYRLERISQLEQLSWSDPHLPFRQSEVLEKEHQYSPDYIQRELEDAYGFDFYQPSELMLLKFEPDFARRYIDNSFRHETFEKIDDLERVMSLIQYAEPTQGEKMIEKVRNNPNHTYYSLQYRKNDNNVIMRLRAWGPKVEVILPWDLRQRMREELNQGWKLYE